jgi:glycosyltransferase involved in cell wall biosynthesis
MIAALVGSGMNVQGFIAGQPYFPEDEDEFRKLKALILSLGIERHVRFLGYVEPLEPLYHAWDICLSTSTYETFGMTVLEAMACGCPVVAYPGGSVAEVVDDAGAVVPDGDLDALVNAVRELAVSPARREDAGRRALQRSRTFDARNSIDALVSEYRAVLSAPSSRLRVLLATNSRDRGSTSRTMESWIRLLPDRGLQPTVTIGGDGPLLTALRTTDVDVHVHPIRVFFDARRPLPFLREMARLVWRLRSKRIQLVHVNEHEHYPVVARAARVPIVVHLRFRPDAAMCRWLFRPPFTPQRLFFTSQTQMNDSAEAVETVVSRDRWRLVYNGLDLGVFGLDRSARGRLRAEWALESRTIAIGTASSISSRKRLDHFVRLIASLAATGVDARGFIAGQPYFPEDEVELRALKTLAKSLGVESRVCFLGYVEPSEPLYHAWDICVSTSAYETFGMTMLEAMACGCPVVAYPGGSVSEVVGGGGTIVDDGDEAALLAAVSDLAASSPRRQEAATLARARAVHFDVRNSVRLLVEEYQAVLAGRSS